MKIKLSKSQWQEIGKTAGWIKPVITAKKKASDDEDDDFIKEKQGFKGKDKSKKDIRDEKKGKEKAKMSFKKDDD